MEKFSLINTYKCIVLRNIKLYSNIILIVKIVTNEKSLISAKRIDSMLGWKKIRNVIKDQRIVITQKGIDENWFR